jgi:hypothetical protein
MPIKDRQEIVYYVGSSDFLKPLPIAAEGDLAAKSPAGTPCIPIGNYKLIIRGNQLVVLDNRLLRKVARKSMYVIRSLIDK